MLYDWNECSSVKSFSQDLSQDEDDHDGEGFLPGSHRCVTDVSGAPREGVVTHSGYLHKKGSGFPWNWKLRFCIYFRSK